jgi:hypothetical protein
METGQELSGLYRFGFLISTIPDGVRSRPNESWRQETIGGLSILLHNETELRHVTTLAGSVTILGPVFAIGDHADLDSILVR